MEQPKIGDLRVWHIPQIPGQAFLVGVDTPAEGHRVLGILAHYDLFQFEHRIKPDYCNAGGLQIWEPEEGTGNLEWCEWHDEETGD